MTGAKFEYDESGTTFFYFLLSFEALVVLPCTFYYYPRSASRQEEKDKTVCHCMGCCMKNTKLRSKEPWKKAKERCIKFLLFIGWLTLFLTIYKVGHLQHDYVAYDPFEILQIEPEASMAEIKKAYRRLSLVYHPDKESGDEIKFMMIAKAYAALTVDEARKNWEIYGNPDGPGPTSFGIALPSWIVQKENSFVVLGVYALVFMIALPVGVTLWWYRCRKYGGGGEEILLDTSHLYYYFINKTPHMIFKRVIMIIAASLEFHRENNSEIIERPSDNVEVPQLMKELSNLGEKNKERPLCFSYSIKARTLIHAHLSRLKLSNALESDKLVIIKKCPYLLQEFISCTAQLTMLALAGRITRMPNLTTMENAMKLCPCLVQALYYNKSSLLQLPHLNEEILRHFTTRKRHIRSIFDLAYMEDDDRRDMLRGLSDDQYQDVMNVIAKLPVIELEVKSEVLDDEDSFNITTGAIVTVTVNLIRKNLSDVIKENEEIDAEDDMAEQVNIANGDISPKVKKTKAWEKNKKKKSKGGGRRTKKREKERVCVPEKAPVCVAKNTANRKYQNSSEKNLPNGISENEKMDEKKESIYSGTEERDALCDSESDSSLSVEAEENDRDENNKNDRDMDDADDQWEKFMKKKETVLETKKSKKSHTVHCPFFPLEKDEHWWLYLADKHKHALITNPYFVTNLVTKEEVELKFAAPSKPGLYTYSVMVRSDSYIDLDVVKTIQLDVKEAKEVDITKVQWDVSEEEEEKDEEESAVEDSDLASDEVDDE